MSTVLRIGTPSKGQTALPEEHSTPRIALIQALIPLGLQAVQDVLQQEVAALAGPRYARHDSAPHVVRWGRQRGSIFLADQKLAIPVPRVRDRRAGLEVPVQSYARLQEPRAADEGVLRRILYGLSCRDYRAAAEAVPEAFGLSRSTISRRYIHATARKLAALQERRLDRDDVVTLVLDGKRFAEDTMVIAVGITLRGEKVLLGFVQTGTGERDGLRGVPAQPPDPRAARRRGSAGGDRWQQGAAARGPGGLRGAGPGPALRLAQTRECGGLPAQTSPGGVASEVCSKHIASPPMRWRRRP